MYYIKLGYFHFDDTLLLCKSLVRKQVYSEASRSLVRLSLMDITHKDAREKTNAPRQSVSSLRLRRHYFHLASFRPWVD
jgi:hypothetical protein